MLAQSHRFHGLSALRPLYKGGRIVRGRSLSMRYQLRKDDSYRAAVVVSKKVHKSAVVRNRIRRRIYEVLRTEDQQLVRGLDLALYIYAVDFAVLPYDKVRTEVVGLLSKARATTVIPGKHAIVEQEGE